ncbi:MAG TPA: tripartite tricarboxylate transporter substrate binding protein [Burkholderiales bacterium]|nr:tripartite tricarboxylate transporter substrate binding protein [Burkholderiales bacterium]
MKKMVTVTALMVWSVLAHAQAASSSYPSKPVRLIVPFPPAETMDVMSRLIGPKLSERLGQPVVIENRPGASGMLGLDLVAKSAPDGYTIGAGQGGNMVILPHTSRNIPYNALKDFAPIALSTTNYLAIVGALNAPFKNIGEMVAYAKANPGRLTVATNGEGGFPHLAFEHLRTMAGFTFTHVPYKGASAIMTDIVGGQVLTGITSIATATPQVKSERVRMLAVTNRTRVALWPDVPAADEAVPGYESNGWFGYVAPAGTPRNIVLKLNAEINRAIRQPDVSEKLVNAGLTIVTESPEYFAEYFKRDYAKYGKLVKDIGYTPQ